jgi:hypothetical protein
MSGSLPIQFNSGIDPARSLMGNSSPISSAQLQGVDPNAFAQALDNANQSLLTLDNFLKYRLIGKDLHALQDGKNVFTGMITNLEKNENGYFAKVFDPRSRNRSKPIFDLPIYFQESKSGPADLVDRDALRLHRERIEKMKTEHYINSTELVELEPTPISQSIDHFQSYKRISDHIQYIDKYGKEKSGNIVMKNNKLFLDNGHEIVIKFGKYE